jgi:tRNA uracil 4-sulfurtransferase
LGTTFVVHYSEIALKGKNRPEFVRGLRRNLAKALTGLSPDISYSEGRFTIMTDGDQREASERLRRVFGVAWFSPVSVVNPDIDAIQSAVVAAAKDSEGRSFKIDPRRSDKSFPMSSHEMAVRLGAAVEAATSKKVDLANPDVDLRVDVTRSQALVYSDKRAGPGGLPVGSAGRVMHLFSGGIDSPVAAWLLMKRGCVPVYLHFYLAPTPQAAIESKVVRLVKTLAAYGGKSTLVFVPFAEYQLATSGAPGDIEPSLFRRFMRMTAEALAPAFGAVALSTGDSLSQAASQTLWNTASFDRGSSIPVLRPLLTYDKEEIIKLARSIGTYDASIEEYKDCCAMITRHPRTRVKPDTLDDYVSRFELHKLVWGTLERATLASFNPYKAELKVAPLAESMPSAASIVSESDL